MSDLLKPDPRISFPALPPGVPRLDPGAAPANPLALLQEWVSFVLAIDAREPMYVTLATASAAGVPSSRTVQLLEVEDEALRFTTNRGSRKGVEMDETGRAAVSIYWRETAQSVNVTGTVEWADAAESDRRFQEDPRAVQASRVVSFHGRPLEDEAAQLVELAAVRDADGPIDRPDYWQWLRIVPDAVTFWEGHPDAMNRRLHYARTASGWTHAPIQA